MAGHRRPPVEPREVVVEPPRFDGDGAVAWIDGTTGKALSMDDVVARLRSQPVSVIGEQHDQASHHEVQRRLVEVLAADGGLVVGLEMLTREHQPVLERFNRGEITIEELGETVDWKKAWGFDLELYAPILRDGHNAGARFVALNAPRSLVKAIRQGGLERLSPDQKAQLPDMDLGDTLHRAWFEAVFAQSGHALSESDLDAFYRAQVLWDETMAEGAVAALQGSKRVVVLAGVGHIAMGRGIPERVERRLWGARALSVVPLGGVDASNFEARVKEAIQDGEGDILAVPRFENEIAL